MEEKTLPQCCVPKFVRVFSPYLRRAIQQANWDGHHVAFRHPFASFIRESAILTHSVRWTWLFAPDSTPQNAVFVLEGLLQRDLRILHGHAVRRRHGGIDAQSLADNAFKIGEGLQLVHGRRICLAGAQFGSELGLDGRVAGERK
jgi:hypothetical protein